MEFLKHQGILKYNTDVKFCGNNVSVKLYDQPQLKGYKVNNVGSFDGGFPKHREELENLMSKNVHELIKLKCRLKIEEIETIKRERWERSNRRAKQKVLDLVACNANKWLDFEGKKQYTKFITLTFKKNDMFTTNLEWCNNELQKYMKRISYNLYGVRKNVLKYIAVPELQKRGVWHYHIIFFNLPYVKHYKLLKWWGGKKFGSVNVKAINKKSEGMVSRYVVKYMVEGIGSEDKKEKEEEKAEYEKYKERGLENTRRYNPSRGLHQPLKLSYTTKKIEFEELVKFLSVGGYLEKLSEDNKNLIDYQVCYSEERGKITYINFTIKDKKILNKIKNDMFKKAYKAIPIWKGKNKFLLNEYKHSINYDKNYKYGSKEKRPPKLNDDAEIRKHQARTFDYYKNQWSIKVV